MPFEDLGQRVSAEMSCAAAAAQEHDAFFGSSSGYNVRLGVHLGQFPSKLTQGTRDCFEPLFWGLEETLAAGSSCFFLFVCLGHQSNLLKMMTAPKKSGSMSATSQKFLAQKGVEGNVEGNVEGMSRAIVMSREMSRECRGQFLMSREMSRECRGQFLMSREMSRECRGQFLMSRETHRR